MSIFSKIAGIIGDSFQFSKVAGFILRNVTGIAEFRNAGNTDYAIVRAATPVGNNDVVIKSHLDTSLSALSALLAVPLGGEIAYWGSAEPAGGAWKFPIGTELDKTTYKNLYLLAGFGLAHGDGTAVSTFTVDTATEELIKTAHGLSVNTILTFSTTTTLPAGLSLATTYYVISVTANRFIVSLTEGGSAVNITGTGTGTHSYHTGFKLPDKRGRVNAAKDNMGGSALNLMVDAQADILGGKMGAETHTLTTAQLASHNHVAPFYTGATTLASGSAISINQTVTNFTGGGNAHNNTQPTIFCNSLIRVL